MKKTELAYYAAMMAALSGMGFQDMYAERRPVLATDHKPRLSMDDELASKGLAKFAINGETIIAHSLKEAQKRYNHNHKR